MRWFYSFTVVLVVLLALGFDYLVVDTQSRYDSFHRQCAEQGGHLYRPASTEWCLTDDGRFIEIYP